MSKFRVIPIFCLLVIASFSGAQTLRPSGTNAATNVRDPYQQFQKGKTISTADKKRAASFDRMKVLEKKWADLSKKKMKTSLSTNHLQGLSGPSSPSLPSYKFDFAVPAATHRSNSAKLRHAILIAATESPDSKAKNQLPATKPGLVGLGTIDIQKQKQSNGTKSPLSKDSIRDQKARTTKAG